MKKILFLLISVGLPVVLSAQSTCQTRVDAHQNATTKERVAYCLTPESATVDNHYSKLIYSGISQYNSPADSAPQQQLHSNAKQGTYRLNNYDLYRTYVGTPQFPQILTEQQPVQMTAYPQEVYAQSGTVVVTQPGQGYTSSTQYTTQLVSSQPDAKSEEEDFFTQTNETQAGINARKNKPGRRWISPEPTIQAQPAATAQVNFSDAPYTYQNDLTPANSTSTNSTTEVSSGLSTPANDPLNVGVNPYTEIPTDSQAAMPVASN